LIYSLHLFIVSDDNVITQNKQGDNMKDSIINLLNDSKIEYTSGVYKHDDLWIECNGSFAYVLKDCIIVGPKGADFMAATECKTVDHAMMFFKN
jgi:hypothetical protein